ncbi:MAG: tetratricopeptide repeat protein [Kangiella sp.]|nr:tetratricopeptide repeat protein [Kangiella sp.]
MAYETEEQQVEAIKQFWKENGTAIILGAVIGFGALFGWGEYQDHKTRQAELASLAYSEILTLSEQSSSDNSELVSKVDAIRTEHATSSYASLAAMSLAETYASDNKFEEAAEQLQWVVDQSNDTFESIAQLRLARVQLQLEKYGDAIATADSIDEPAFKGNALLVKAEALIAQGKNDEAKSVLIEARDAGNGAVSPLLQMRISEFGIDN